MAEGKFFLDGPRQRRPEGDLVDKMAVHDVQVDDVDAVGGEGAQLGFQVEKIRGQDRGEKRVHLLTWMPIRFLALISNPGDGNCLRMMPGFSPK